MVSVFHLLDFGRATVALSEFARVRSALDRGSPPTSPSSQLLARAATHDDRHHELSVLYHAQRSR